MQLQNDDEQMDRVRSGDNSAMEALYHSLAPGLAGYLSKLGVSRDEVADLVQETFIKVWRSRLRYEGKGIRPWVYAIARNAATDLLRRRRPTSVESGVADTEASPEEEAVASEIEGRLKLALARLPELTREVVLLSRYSNMSLKDIGKTLEISEANVKVRLHRGLKTLLEEVDV